MAMQSEAKLLRQFIKSGGSTAEIAVALGYKTSVTIEGWVHQKRVPARACAPLMEFLKKKGAVNVISGESNEG